MLQKSVLALLTLLWLSPTLAQPQFSCGQGAGQPAPTISYQPGDDADLTLGIKQFEGKILDYLNAAGTDGLQTALNAAGLNGLPDPEGSYFPRTTSDVIEAEFTDDNSPDVLINLTINDPTRYAELLILNTCTNTGYKQLDAILNNAQGDFDMPATAVQYALDINNNQRRDIILTREWPSGMTYSRSLDIYEWDGNKLAQTYSIGPDLGLSPHPLLENRDDDLATLELVVGNTYGYGQSVLNSVNEIPFRRPVEELYHWNGTTYNLVCKRFTDSPDLLVMAVHTAEVALKCGDFTSASQTYLAIWSTNDWQPWGQTASVVIPSNVTDAAAYIADVERNYLQAFAELRLMQISIAQGNTSNTEDLLVGMQNRHPIHSQGYIYTAMADSLYKTLQQTNDIEAACTAAQQTFQAVKASGDDPGIDYQTMTENGQTRKLHFYDDGPVQVSSDPDNIFDVPPDIQDMIDMPVCL